MNYAPKIGILGAPGSGKQPLAEEIEVAFDIREPTVCDPVEHIPVDADPYDWRIGMELYGFTKLERAIMEWNEPYVIDPLIELSTPLDRLAHLGARLMDLSSRVLDLKGSERDELLQLQQVSPVLSIAFMELWDYDYAFYLPASLESDETSRAIDEALQSLMASYIDLGIDLGIMRLDGGSSSERAATVKNVLAKMEPSRIERLEKLHEIESAVRDEDANDVNGSDTGVAPDAE